MPDVLKVMYVDDSDDIRSIVQFTLEDEDDFEVKICSSGQEALDTIGIFQPNLVLLDVMMPHMDGPTTLIKIRAQPGFEKLPIAFITAKVQRQEIDQFKALGAIEVIIKPFDPLRLADQIRELWARSRRE